MPVMSRACRIPGCTRKIVNRHSIYCNAHDLNHRKNGHPQQEAVTKWDIRSYRSMVDDRFRRAHVQWEPIERRWLSVVSLANEIEAGWRRGKASPTHLRTAAFEILLLHREVDPKEIIKTVCALYLMQAHRPHFFKSDRGFGFQVVRRLRGLTDTDNRTYHDRSGKVAYTYRKHLPPKVIDLMLQWITTALGPVGLKLVQLETTEREKSIHARADFAKALDSLRVPFPEPEEAGLR
jgi:hypothetical protein